MTILKWLLIVVTLGYIALIAVMYVAQRTLMYFPDRQRVAPAAAGFPQAQEVALDGDQLIAWHVPPRGDKPVILYFHGNGGALQHRVHRFAPLVADGTGLLALSYPGYAGSTGSPGETAFLNAADLLYVHAAGRYPANRIVVWGESIGSGVAVALAATHEVAAVVLEAPFTSTLDVGAKAFWFAPVWLLMKDTFRSDERIGKVRAPVLILHGEQDRTVPFAFGEKLFSLANEPKRFVRFPRGNHNDLDSYGAVEAAKKFLTEQVR
jgi:fermentation-respiration switch protein FrsA (DUF1100 family)